MKILLLFLALSALSYAQNPPSWPNAMSATLFVRKHGSEIHDNWNLYYRWFHDNSLQKIRLDGGYEYKGDSVWMQSIIDLKEEYYYAAFFHDWLTAECFEGKTNWTFTAPDFSDWKYIGNSIVAFRECDHWVAPSFENKKMIHYWVTSDTQEPKQVEFLDHKGNLWSATFLEVNVGAQSEHLFSLPESLQGKCTPASI